MPAHQRVKAWVAHNYRKPAIDQEWLADCSDWVSTELGLDPERDFDQFIHNVEAQLLQSSLTDSTVPGSGINPLLVASNQNPPSAARRLGRQAPRQKKNTGPTPLLVEIKSITEIAHSAFSLLNTHQTRLDRADLGLAREDNPEQPRDEDEGPVPRFPRGMLRFELSDGLTTFRAIEFRPLPELELGTTPLGYKMLLRSTPIRSGVAFLEPTNVVLKGYKTEDHDVHREQVFLSSLRKRLGRPDPPPEESAQPPANPADQPAPAQPTRQQHPPPAARPPSPPIDMDDMYADDVDPDVLREMAIEMDEAIDMQGNQRASARTVPPAKTTSTSVSHAAGSSSNQSSRTNTTIASSSLTKGPSTSTLKTSPYFTTDTSGSKPIPDIGLSPRPVPPSDPDDFDITWDLDKPEAPKPVKKLGSVSTKPPSTTPSKQGISAKKRSSSPDPFDDLSFDMDVDESFLEQVGMIEKGVLGAANKGKGKAKDAGSQGTALGKKTTATGSGPALGTTRFVIPPVSLVGTEPSTSIQGRTERARSASSMSGSTKADMPRSTQSSDRRIPRDPSLIIISSEEDEAAGSGGVERPFDLARRHTNKGRKMDDNEFADSEVIDLSD